MTNKHIIICGARGVGKSTLIEKLLSHCTLPIYGYFTRSTPRREDGSHSIYIYPAGSKERPRSEKNHVGDCNQKHPNVNPEVFATLGCEYLKSKPDGIIAMDEIGFMEKNISAFCSKVLQCLDGNTPVLATIKDKYDVDYLNQIRAHPNVQVYTITPENRDTLYQELLPILLKWNKNRT